MKFLPTLTLGAMLLGSVGCASNLENVVARKPIRPERTIQKETSSLYVNSNKEHYVVEKSRESGENDVLGLTLTDDQEEAWVFVEYSDGREVWYENGVEIEGEKDRIGLGEKSLLEILKSKEDIEYISISHFHPVEMDRNYDHSQTPSLDDFEGFVGLLSKINNTLNETDRNSRLIDNLDFKIVVSTGIYTVKFNSRLFFDERDEDWDELSKTIYDIFLTRMASVTGDYDEFGEYVGFDYSQSNRENFAEVNKRFAEKFNSDLMRFTFEPREVY